MNFLFKPQTAFVLPLLAGIFFWLLPVTDLRNGFTSRATLSVAAIILLAGFYLAIFAGATLGQHFSRWLHPKPMFTLSPSRDFVIYLVLSIIGIAGTASTLATSMASGISLTSVIEDRTGNDLKDSLYENYSFAATPRYVTAISGALGAVFLAAGRYRKWMIMHALNMLCLLFVALFSARLLLIESVFIGVGLCVVFGHPPRFTFKRAAAIGISLMLILVFYTAIRTAGTYEQEYGMTSAFEVLFAQVRAYVSVPVQVSLGIANYSLTDSQALSLSGLDRVILPTFLQDKTMQADNSGGVGMQWYIDVVDFDPRLTTNSAFAFLYEDIHLWSILFIFLVAFFLGTFAYWFFCYQDLRCLPFLVVSYPFAELWRDYHFFQGYFIFQLIAVLGAILVALVAPRQLAGRLTATESSAYS